MTQHNTHVICPVCGHSVALKGTDRIGEAVLAWHVRDNFKKCEGSGRPPATARYLEKRPGVRGQ